ncbi:MAG: carbamoyltransferase HypF [Betaproteobacteria bacterium]|nr:carbamoyltransferase HypF [Betaproteobacteria bacterium]
MSPSESALARRARIRVRGVVQGVGFRPFVYRLAQELELSGWVRNDGMGVELEAQGAPARLSALLARLPREAPPLARIDAIDSEACAPQPRAQGFAIVASTAGGRVATAIGADSAECPDCLAEMLDPADRRWRYPFINCTHCGPRYTITRALPYDRPNTSMAVFHQCPRCLAEYRDPADRRFHAEPNACPVCGPHLTLLDAEGRRVPTGDPLAEVMLHLLCGEIVAVKGLGGFHLMCDARDGRAVERLRARKAREQKPFAVMVANVASARRWARLSPAEEAMLAGRERPIVLARSRPSVARELCGVAPGLEQIGVMLPYAPLHVLLFHEHAGRPRGTAWLDRSQELALVCTSANPGGEPLVIGNDEALRRLSGIADAFLIHDRDVLVRCDDSVVRVVQGCATHPATTQFVRRGRGYTPAAIPLGGDGPVVLAFGAHLKNALCLARGSEAFLSQHVGDLDNAATCRALDEVAEHLQRVLAVRPDLVAHDLHPDFHSSRAAAELARRLGIPAVAVQHHHAHVAAVVAEHHHDGPVLGVALDGYGLGSDGGAWGGELLLVDGAASTRIGSLRPLLLPGGDRAAREPWRMAAAALHALGREGEIVPRFRSQAAASTVAGMLGRHLNSPPTTSLGRWFDAAAGLLGVSAVMDYEGQAAMQLEGLAHTYGPALQLAGGWQLGDGHELNLLPLLAAMAGERDAQRGAAVFHATLCAALEEWILRAAGDTGLDTVALSGGCMLNRILSRGLAGRLAARGLTVLEARLAPPNDGGLALGQAWVARRAVR